MYFLPYELWEHILIHIDDIHCIITLSKINNIFASILKEENTKFWKRWVTYNYCNFDDLIYTITKYNVGLMESIRLFEEPEPCNICGKMLQGFDKPPSHNYECIYCYRGL